MVTNGVSTWAESKGLTWVYSYIVAAHLASKYRYSLTIRLYPDYMDVLDDDLEVVMEKFSYNGAGTIPVESEVGYVEVFFINNTILFPHEY